MRNYSSFEPNFFQSLLFLLVFGVLPLAVVLGIIFAAMRVLAKWRQNQANPKRANWLFFPMALAIGIIIALLIDNILD